MIHGTASTAPVPFLVSIRLFEKDEHEGIPFAYFFGTKWKSHPT
jgi:hypothetical protein